MQQSNPELVEQLRSQMRGQNATSPDDDDATNDQSQSGMDGLAKLSDCFTAGDMSDIVNYLSVR